MFAHASTLARVRATYCSVSSRCRLGQEILKQPQYRPVSLPNEIVILYAVNNGFLDDVAVKDVAAFVYTSTH